MKKSLLFTVLAAAAAAGLVGCEKSTPPRAGYVDPDLVSFSASGLSMEVSTKATEVTSSNLGTFNVIAASGAAGSQTQVWSTTATQVGSTAVWTTDKYWPSTDQGYTSFYASNAALAFNAAGPTVSPADNSVDVVVAHCASPAYREQNALTFNHVFARVGSITLNTQSGYSLSAVSATLQSPVTGGTYNLRTNAWTSGAAGANQAMAAFSGTTSAQSSSNDYWVVPGDYTLSVSYTLTKGDYSEAFTKTGTVTLVQGKTNAITATAVGGYASEIVFGVSVTSWSANSITLEWDNYLTFEATGSGNIVWTAYENSSVKKTVQYRKNSGAWTDITSTGSGATIAVSSGDIVEFKGDNESYSLYDENDEIRYWNYFSATVPCYVYGDVTSLLHDRTLTSYCFYGLFHVGSSTNPNIINHPSKQIELPATTLASYCYSFMFDGCTGLTSAPALPATTLASSCYSFMFFGCTGLTSAPVLPATTLVSFCYYNMFRDCTGLNYVKALFTTTPGTSSTTNNWLSGVKSTGTFVKNSAATWDLSGASGIPSGWTVETASE